ncbi:MAG: hypothetical protein WAU02_04010 [Candidatus Saccharimonadales bacterium]
MQFVDTLPELPVALQWNISAPQGGLSESVQAILAGRAEFLDVKIVVMGYEARVRVYLNASDLTPDETRPSTWHFNNVLAEFLDADYQPTFRLAEASGVIYTSPVVNGHVTGQMRLWMPTASSFSQPA